MATTFLSDVWNSTMTTDSLEETGGPSVLSHPMYKLRNQLWYFGGPVILLLGNFGNIMTILIMRRMTSGESAVNIYFTGLAIVDLVTLDVFLLGEWLKITFSVWIKHESDAMCKIYNWISTCSTTISAWFLVCLTVHRAMSVVWPHRVNLLCTRQKVSVLLAGTAIFLAAVYSHYLYGYHLVFVNSLNTVRCVLLEGSYLTFIEEVFTYIDLVLYSLLPFTCLIIANSVLVWKLRATVRETRHKFAQGSDQTEARQKTTTSVTVTVIFVSTAFIVLTLPSSLFHVIFYVAVSSRSASINDLALLYFISAIIYMLLFCNHGVNFYLYCLTGKRFREEFVKIICCGRVHKLQDASSISEASSKRYAVR